MSGYASDLTDGQWAQIESLLIGKRGGPGRPMELSLRAVVNAILYVLRTGCQWAYLPHDYPKAMGGRTHFAWLGRSRRLSKDYEMRVDNSEGMVYLASVQRLLKHLAPTS